MKTKSVRPQLLVAERVIAKDLFTPGEYSVVGCGWPFAPGQCEHSGCKDQKKDAGRR
jgi:hypothetical protein